MDFHLRLGLSFLTSLILGFFIAPKWIAFLKKQKLEQFQRTENEVRQLAKLNQSKDHTPTLGGIIFLLPFVLSAIIWAHWNFLVWSTLGITLSLAFLGLLDDLRKIRAQNSRGVSGKMKLLFQFLVVGIWWCWITGTDPEYATQLHQIWIPLKSTPLITYLPTIFLIPFFFLVIAGSSNAVNLTDGADGLATGTTIPVVFVFLVIALMEGFPLSATLFHLPFIENALELSILCSALLGGLVAFLWHNAHPASIFMGDMGALALGGFLGIIALLLLQPFALAIGGGVLVAESLSDILQVYGFKLTHGKRLFKMAPLHHHFQLSGWPETKVVSRFVIASWIFSITTIFLFL